MIEDNKTYLGTAKNALRRLDERQRQPASVTIAHSAEEHTCENCGATFTGRFCPQCGMNCERSRLTFKNVVQNVLDVWGLGNRPMFRTIRELFWRPGYMMRDYLRGRQQSYFPPVKMIFLLSMFMLLEAGLLGLQVKPDKTFIDVTNTPDGEPATEEVIEIGQTINEIVNQSITWIYTHPAEMTIAECLVLIFIVARVFRNSPGIGSITRTEAFFTQIYIECQVFCVLILCMPFYALAHHGQTILLSQYMSAISPFNAILYVIDFKQLFQFSLRQTIWKIVKFYLIFLSLILVGMLIAGFALGIYMVSISST